MDAVAERVARGVALLDTQRPGWANEICLPDLDIDDPCGCVLGHLFASGRLSGFHVGTHALTGGSVKRELTPEQLEWSRGHGFEATKRLAAGETLRLDYDDLQAEWSRVIAERQAVTS